MIDDSTRAARLDELANRAWFADYLAAEVVPWVRARHHVARDPHRVILAGSSAGGLAATHAALRHPETFGNVLSQSGAFWRGNGPRTTRRTSGSRGTSRRRRDATCGSGSRSAPPEVAARWAGRRRRSWRPIARSATLATRQGLSRGLRRGAERRPRIRDVGRTSPAASSRSRTPDRDDGSRPTGVQRPPRRLVHARIGIIRRTHIAPVTRQTQSQQQHRGPLESGRRRSLLDRLTLDVLADRHRRRCPTRARCRRRSDVRPES